jgi:hypothetical protein
MVKKTLNAAGNGLPEPVNGISKALGNFYSQVVGVVKNDPIIGGIVTGITTALSLRLFNSFVPKGTLV